MEGVTMVKPAALIAIVILLGCAACGETPTAPSAGVTWAPLTDLSPLAGTGWIGTGTASDDSGSHTFTSTLGFSGIGTLNGVNVQQGNAAIDSSSGLNLGLTFWGTVNMFDLHRGCVIALPRGTILGVNPVTWTTLERSSDGKQIRLTVSGSFGFIKDGSFTWTKVS
jgi:hypothetical protein